MLSSEGEEGEAKCSQRSLTGPDGMLRRALVVGVRCAYLRGARARPKRTIFYVLVDGLFVLNFEILRANARRGRRPRVYRGFNPPPPIA
jgi:hypothetical protein